MWFHLASSINQRASEAIDKLISQGINAGDVKKLQDARIFTCNGLMMHTKKNLTGIKGLSEAKVDKICEAAEKLVNSGYITGSDALLKRKSVVRITTGSQALDELLGGGNALGSKVVAEILVRRAIRYILHIH